MRIGFTGVTGDKQPGKKIGPGPSFSSPPNISTVDVRDYEESAPKRPH